MGGGCIPLGSGKSLVSKMTLDVINCQSCSNIKVVSDESLRRAFVCSVNSESFPEAAGCSMLNKSQVAPVAWIQQDHLEQVKSWGTTDCRLYPHNYDGTDLAPLYTQLPK